MEANAVKTPKIPFFRPITVGNEAHHIEECIRLGNWAGDGPFNARCSQLLEEFAGAPVFLTPSGTHALELAFMTLDLKPGDEVILPSFTFVSTANCIVLNGLKPVFIDIRPDTLNLDEGLIEQAITDRTRAILPVHYAGVPCEMAIITQLAKRHGLFVVEDAAQAFNSLYKDQPAGALGHMGIYSFHHSKNLTCGEGGAIIVSDDKYLKKLKIHRQKGTDRDFYFEGKVDKYSWIDRGSSYLMSDLLAAFLLAQLEKREEILQMRRQSFDYYREGLASLAPEFLQLPNVPEGCLSNGHLFYLLTRNREIRDGLQNFLMANNVEALTHFVPLHSSAGGKRFGIVRGPMEATRRAEECLLRLPLHAGITNEDQDTVVDSVKEFFLKPQGNRS